MGGGGDGHPFRESKHLPSHFQRINDMNKIVSAALTVLALSLVSQNASAFKLPGKKDPVPPVDYTGWISIQELPSQEDGVLLFYPSTEPADGSAVIKGNMVVEGLDSRKVFLATLLFAVNNLDTDNGECLHSVDYDKEEFSVMLKSTQGSNNKETTYTRYLKVKSNAGNFDFVTTDIAVRYREKGIIPRTLPLASLHPESNTRHEELVMELTRVNSSYINEMARYAVGRPDIEAPNLTSGGNVKVSVGMNPDEVSILLGPPLEQRKSGEKLRWIYGNETVVFFIEGKVSRVIE